MPFTWSRDASRAIVSLGTFLIALISMLGAAEIYLEHQRTVEAAYSRLENLARIVDEGISGRMRAVDLMLQDVGRESGTARSAAGEGALVAYMKARAASFEEVRNLSVTDRTGVIAHTTLPEIKGFDARERPYYREPLNAGDRDRLFVIGPMKASTGAVFIFASRAKETADGRWDGVVVASLPPAYFASILETIRPQDDGFAALMTADGTIVAGAPDQDRYLGVKVGPGSGFADHLASGQRMTRAYADLKPLDPHSRFVVTRSTAVPELLVAVGLSTDTALAGWRRHAVVKGTVLATLAVFMAVVLRLFFKRERDLRVQRNFATNLIESANAMVVGLDREGAIIVFNGAAEALSGYRKDEVLGRSWFETLMPRDRFPDGDEPFFDAIRQGRPGLQRFEGPILTRGGAERIIAWQISWTPTGRLASLFFGMDMTDRLAVERELLESQRFLKAVTDNTPGMVGYWDADLRCRFANRAYLEWFGRDAGAILGRSIRDLLGDRLFALNEPYIRAALAGEPQVFERTLTKPGGEVGYTWAHYIPDVDRDSGRVAGFFVLVTDVTALKLAEVRLQAVSRRLALATRAGGIGVWDYDPGNGTLVWDDRMFALYGVAPVDDHATYALWRARCHPDDVDRVDAEFSAALNGAGAFDTEFRVVTPAGEVRHIKAAALLEKDADSATGRMVGVNYDITPLREGERALAEAKVRAELASRAKSEFLANMSHEIRTPMNAIMGLCHLLAGTGMEPLQRDYVAKIDSAARSLLGIINDILDFSKVEAGRLELERSPFRLADLMDGLATVMSVSAAAKDLELIIRVDPDVPGHLQGDPLRLQQILINLTGNAIKFTNAGAVVVRVHRAGGDGDRVVLRFEVADTGIGIAAADRARLFDAFSQADSSTTRRFGGSGLGLAISRRLVDLMGGSIEVESEEGKGSTFRFTVPFAPAPPQESVPPVADRGLDVLVVDDHDGAREALAAAVSGFGWHAECVGSAEEALPRVWERRGRSRPYDLLIVDWTLPGMDGLTLGRAVRDADGPLRTPIVLTVPAFRRDEVTKSPDAGCVDAILVKPLTASALLNAVLAARAAREKGTDFLVRAAGAAESRGPALDGVRLLMVEDNAINQEVARRILEREGAEVTVANNGEEAVALLAASPRRFDAVLMDIQMPVMDGYEATRRIRRMPDLAGLPVIALTAGALASERQRAQDAGMDGFVTKPFDVATMIRTVRHHLAGAAPGAAGPGPVPPPAPWPAVSGIDGRQAFDRLGGDAALFGALLAGLVREFDGTVAAVRDLLAAGDPAAALRRLHTLRGAAGNVGAVAVAALALDAEAAIRSGDRDAVDDRLARLDGASASLFAAIRTAGAAEASGARQADGADLSALLDRLDRRAMDAVDLFATLRPAVAAVAGADRTHRIADAVDGLRFAEAAALLREAVDGLTTPAARP
ncbi:response regulator [Azospirillum sp. ST 5-10]|uniref:response regulator n=1 Tax=unclassified Azospirillum TaxID=2630922 RepID=UPI003F4A8119